ncbi:hypothetical protein K474DRAFT_44101 [Panus rudis PR-1116 ss-1]|nr:hypothetical protein K474DRAFT_44101 [Panus rudis PR-1116 ss-1]
MATRARNQPARLAKSDPALNTIASLLQPSYIQWPSDAHDVYRMEYSEAMLQRYHAYRRKISSQLSAHAGEEQLVVQRDVVAPCPFTIAGDPAHCRDETCLSCNVFRAPVVPPYQSGRFGRGIYLCRKLSIGSGTPVPEDPTVVVVYRAQLGKTSKTHKDAPYAYQAPLGFHSVAGILSPESSLGEVVLYDSDALVPAYVVVFKNEVSQTPAVSTSPSPLESTSLETHTINVAVDTDPLLHWIGSSDSMGNAEARRLPDSERVSSSCLARSPDSIVAHKQMAGRIINWIRLTSCIEVSASERDERIRVFRQLVDTDGGEAGVRSLPKKEMKSTLDTIQNVSLKPGSDFKLRGTTL